MGSGLSETRLNRFLRGRKRDDYVLSSKVGRLLQACPPEQRTGIGKFFDTPSRREQYDYSHDGVMRSVEFSLERLGVDRIDILYAHDLDTFTHGSQEAMQARLEEFMASGYSALLSLRDQGVIKAFGAGINEWQPAQWLAERGDFDLFLLAGRYTLLEQESLESFLPLCEKRGIGIVLGGPYNSGVLATGPRPGAYYNYSEAPQDDPRQGRAHRGGLRAARRQAGRGGAAVSAAASERRLGHPGRPERRAGAQQPRHPRRRHPERPVARSQVRRVDAAGRTDRMTTRRRRGTAA